MFKFVVKFKGLFTRSLIRRFLVNKRFPNYSRISSPIHKCSLIIELSNDVLGSSVRQLVHQLTVHQSLLEQSLASTFTLVNPKRPVRDEGLLNIKKDARNLIRSYCLDNSPSCNHGTYRLMGHNSA